MCKLLLRVMLTHSTGKWVSALNPLMQGIRRKEYLDLIRFNPQ
jgi:hypothetical protein